MENSFHYEDIPPQNWLDDLHSFNLTKIWDIQLNNNQRTNLIFRAQERLKEWRIGLRDQLKKIENRYDSSKQDKMEQLLVPYKMLDSLGTDINTQLRDLEQRMKAGKAIPQGFEFGTRIFGDLPSKRWQLGERDDENLWKEFMAVERRYKLLAQEYNNQSRGYKNAQQRVNETQTDLDALTKGYKKEAGCLQIGLRLFIVLLAVVFTLVLGVIALLIEFPLGASVSNGIVATFMLSLSVVAAIVAVVLARRRRASAAALQSEVADMQQNLKQAQQESQRQKQYLLPTRQTFKEIKADYEELKSAF